MVWVQVGKNKRVVMSGRSMSTQGSKKVSFGMPEEIATGTWGHGWAEDFEWQAEELGPHFSSQGSSSAALLWAHSPQSGSVWLQPILLNPDLSWAPQQPDSAFVALPWHITKAFRIYHRYIPNLPVGDVCWHLHSLGEDTDLHVSWNSLINSLFSMLTF